MTIRIRLRGSPGMRSGTLRIAAESWELATWHRAAKPTRSQIERGTRIALAMARGAGE